MNICFASYRLFPDGPVRQPFLESDPANIAYAVGGHYASYFTLRRMREAELSRFLGQFDLVIAAIDAVDMELSWRIVRAASGRVAGYSEGHIGDYQRLPPRLQAKFLEAVREVQINFLT